MAKRAARPRRSAANRATAAKRGYGHAWRKASKGFLAKHPLCVRCEASGETRAATVVDHVRPHRGDRTLFWDRGNWQPLCERCHNRKTATEDARARV